MTHHDKIDIIRIILQSNCSCNNCVELFKTLFDDNLIDEINAKITKQKTLIKKKIIKVDNCTNDKCKHLFD